MPNSMTGFGRSVYDAPFGKLIVEIQSVNRKFLEIFVSLPREFGRFEHDVRKWVNDAVFRGAVSVRIHLIPSGQALAGLVPDIETMRSLKYGWEKLSQQLGYDPKAIDLPFLASQLSDKSPVEMAKDEDLISFHRTVDEALQNLVKMKKEEGKALVKDLAERLKGLGRHLDEVEKLSPDASKRMREKLAEKMKEVLAPGAELDDRIAREAALFAERVDISEEITRLRSHFKQFEQLLSPKKEAIGRKMDFMIQEMGREINTIGSKSSESKIAHIVVDMKSELEKMREQIQNIE